jgi:hypothetical protein
MAHLPGKCKNKVETTVSRPSATLSRRTGEGIYFWDNLPRVAFALRPYPGLLSVSLTGFQFVFVSFVCFAVKNPLPYFFSAGANGSLSFLR